MKEAYDVPTLAELRKAARRVFGKGTRVSAQSRGLVLKEILIALPGKDIRYLSVADELPTFAKLRAKELIEVYAVLNSKERKDRP